MKIWLLLPITNDQHAHPWSPWYDKAFGFVVRAESEEQARDLAASQQGDEGHDYAVSPWKDKTFSTCEELTPAGDAGVILRDFYAA